MQRQKSLDSNLLASSNNGGAKEPSFSCVTLLLLIDDFTYLHEQGLQFLWALLHVDKYLQRSPQCLQLTAIGGGRGSCRCTAMRHQGHEVWQSLELHLRCLLPQFQILLRSIHMEQRQLESMLLPSGQQLLMRCERALRGGGERGEEETLESIRMGGDHGEKKRRRVVLPRLLYAALLLLPAACPQPCFAAAALPLALSLSHCCCSSQGAMQAGAGAAQSQPAAASTRLIAAVHYC